MARFKSKYKSGLEVRFAAKAKQQGLEVEYEPDKFPYVRPSHYTPDWKIGPDTYIETKGYFAPSDRTKILAFLEQYPQVKLYLMFGNADNKLKKTSRTTYAEWARKHGIEYADIRNPLKRDWWQKINFGRIHRRTNAVANDGKEAGSKKRKRRSRASFSSD